MTKGNDMVTCMPGSQWNKPEYGLTKRELYAAMAMQGMLSNAKTVNEFPIHRTADYAVMLADELITSLNEKRDGE